LQAGEILLAIGGETVSSPAMVAQCLGPEMVGQQIELWVIRAGNLVSSAVTIGSRPSR
jgi:hypothetical protein